ncbi:hypothetical protein [Streptomyces sp. A0592]|uniref:hypothetical protein n=1 Tax=Streptomyces sp. A0592 TaxID=2563099 RepID=UPI001447CDF5|nr:hypothetical protein [Streptomyces sp. A0592]
MNPSIDPRAGGPLGGSPVPPRPTRPARHQSHYVRPPTPEPPPPAATGPSRFAYDDVTRYLCAAMHTDSGLARKTVARIMDEPRRAAASSPGLDLACVLRHALAARRRQRRRDLALSLLLLILVVLIGLLVAFSSTYEILPAAYAVSLLVGCLTAWAIVAVEIFSTHYGVVSRQLKRENFDPSRAPRPRNRGDAARIDAIELRDRGNVVMSSHFAPFVGHGDIYSTWSFALNTARPEKGKQITPFTIHDLNEHISARVGALRLPGMEVAEVLLMNGADLLFGIDGRTRSEVLRNPAGPPGAHVSESLLRELREVDTARARPYLAIRVTGWGGELVSTLFLRCTVLPHREIAFIEGSNCLLSPVNEKYRAVDLILNSPTLRQWFSLVGLAALRTPVLLICAPFSLMGDLLAPFSRRREQRRQARQIRLRTFNYGAEFSVREAASSRLYYRYFQMLDRELYAQTVEHRVLDSLVQFLEDHNIDSSELIQRQTTIYNSGLFAGRDISVTRSNVQAGAGRPQPVKSG